MKGTSTCDICGRFVDTLTRRYKGEGYCSRCYARYFVKRLCPKCGESARLPLDDTSAICRKCEVVKPCIRCGKKEYRTGKITRYGPVCNACSVYFRKPRACPRCGKSSRRLSRAFRLGITDQVCPRCASLDRGTCYSCKRHRRLYKSSSGKLLCKPCRDIGFISCPVCGQQMPAGRKNICESCYWRDLLHKRIELDCSAFCSEMMAEHFKAFGKWLGDHAGYHKASLTIHRYMPFFLDIGLKWGTIPDYQSLLNEFGVLGLRRRLLPIKWMEDSGLIKTDIFLKNATSEKRRIQNILDSIDAEKSEALLLGYYELLCDKYRQTKISLRSIRLALYPAAQLLVKAQIHHRSTPNQKDLEQYLRKTPGQRNSLSGFIHYLNKHPKTNLVLPPASLRASINRRHKSKKELTQLLANPKDNNKYRKRLLSIALNYFHGLPLTHGKTLLNSIKNDHTGGILISFKENSYWLPEAFRIPLQII